MKSKLFITSIIMLIVGIIGRFYAASYTYVDSSGILHDTLWLPISSLLLLAGFFLLLILAVFRGIGYLKMS